MIPVAAVEDLFIRFVEFYRFAHREFVYDGVMENDDVYPLAEVSKAWGDKPEYHLPLAVLNNGDCGVAAVAVGEVIAHYHPHCKVQYHSNGGHAYISVLLGRNVTTRSFNDTIYPAGVLDEDRILQHSNPAIRLRETVSAQDLVNRYLSCQLDVEFVVQFVRFYIPGYVFPYDLPADADRDEWYYEQTPDKEVVTND